MFRCTLALLCAVLVLSNVELIHGRKFGGGGGRRTGGGSHGYPSSGGLSGGGSHGYPSSGGLSGGGSHGYPASSGVSGGSRGGYPAGGSGSHTYPGAGGGSHGYPSGGNSGSHGYPASPSLSGSGSNSRTYPNNKANYPSGGTTNVHHHYHYSPPQQISYASPRGGPPMNYPVYRGTPPTYVYQYKDSGSKYGTLLAGLALMNLGVLGAGIYAHSQSHSNNNNYKPQPGEICKFGLKKDNGDYEETRIDCQLISSFILAEQAKPQNQPTNTTVVTTTVTNTTIVNTTNQVADTPQTPGNVTVNVTYNMLPGGTLVPVNMSSDGTINVTTEAPQVPAGGGSSSSSVVVTTTTNTTVVNALDVKGKPIDVTPGMECYVIRKTPSSNMRKGVPCGLLQTYAEKSIKANSAARNVPAFTLLAVVCAVFVMN
ncbi:hypothetical protein MSG28_003278 [Choristoneura fumiferana]|uniref:Uncharacterized protein n=1 Tax=Choristoneura fumiferana TaxID=7141 RepID=A0ACC0KE72_CHOFU|nr:hypothetical protein MSG28_003278 [Choristoneura fumiferana]